MSEKRILVVDDERQIRDLFAGAFARTGYTVQTVASAEDALELIKKWPPWVLFLDLNLPGMDGLELCRRIHKKWPWQILIAVTGYATLFELTDCREAGFEDYFVKPVNLTELIGAAERAFEKLERWKEQQFLDTKSSE